MELLAALLHKDARAGSVKKQVAGALSVLSEHPTIKVAVAAAGCIEPLVGLLGIWSHPWSQAAEALRALSFQNTDNQRLVSAHLVGLLVGGSIAAVDRSAAVLWRIVQDNPSHQKTIARAGGAAQLATLLRTGHDEAKEYALWALSQCSDPTNQKEVASHDAIPLIVSRLSVKCVPVQEQAAAALAKLAFDDAELCGLIVKAGGIPPLVELLDGSNVSGEAREQAAAALAELAAPAAHREAMVAAGCIQAFSRCFDAAEGPLQHAATAVARMAHEHTELQAQIAAADVIAPLIRLLSGDKGTDAQASAAHALASLAGHQPNHAAILEAGDGIGPFVRRDHG